MKAEIVCDVDCLKVSLTGRFTLTEAKRTFQETLDAVARHKADKVLMDGRSLSGDIEFMERFDYGKFVAELVMQYLGRGAIPACRFAFVLNESLRDPARLGENVAVNRGGTVKTFAAVEEAREWLGLGN